MSEIIKNRYTITNLIGKGGMAEVYLAYDTILNREVAIKILKSDMSDDDIALERFKREAGATTQLSHPNIVDVYDVGDDGDKHFIVMEYVKGYTLKQLIKKRGAIPYKEAVWLTKQIAGALMEAHRNGIIHRDVKSQNVLLKPDGTVKLSDFGIALSADAMQITHKDSVLGSVHYLAPEISRGRQASMQSDIYSLGIVLYELLTGDVPFKADTPVQVALKHVREDIPFVRNINREIPQSVENIIIKATAKSLNNRYKNVALMLKDLNECLKKEHINDERVVIDYTKENSIKNTIHVADGGQVEEKKTFKKIYIFLISGIVILALFILLYFLGVFKFKEKEVVLPNIKDMTVIEAKDLLSEYNLEIDDAHIEYTYTDDVDKDKIVSTSPSIGSSINKNQKIKVVVSSGRFNVLKNYVGKNYKETKLELENLGLIVKLIPIESSKESGLVLSQSLQEGYKFEPNSNEIINIEYSRGDNVITLELKLGMSIIEAEQYLISNNIDTEKYELLAKDYTYFNEDEILNSKPQTIIRIEPEIGSDYDLNSEEPIKIYYYSKAIEINEESENISQ